MRSIALTLFFVLIGVALFTACTKTEKIEVPKYIKEIVKEELDLEDYPYAVKEIKEHVDECGPGVVEGNDGENNCGHKISVSEIIGMKTGLIHEENWHLNPKIEFFESKKLTSPTQWNFLENGKAQAVKVDTQTCGSCWAEATVKAMELFIAGHKKEVLDLAQQTLVSTCKGIGRHGDCQGGYMSAPDVLIKNLGDPIFSGGVTFENRDPYLGKNSSCKFDPSELSAGFSHTVDAAPYVGSSLDHSRFYRNGPKERNDKIDAIKAAMIEKQSPAVVWLNAVSQAKNSKPIMSCGKYSGANHMQVVVGWYDYQNETIADVWNSWGTNHGSGGVFGGEGRTQIKWDCGSGRLNRNLGGNARVLDGETCKNLASAQTGPNKTIILGNAAKIGNLKSDQQCEWTPKAGLSDPFICNPFASPEVSTEYHLKANTECDEKTGMVLVTVLGPVRDKLKNKLLTPHGMIDWNVE